MNPILAPLFARRSVRKYQSKPVPEALLRDVLEAAMAAPSANEKDPWEILVVQNPETLANIAAGLSSTGSRSSGNSGELAHCHVSTCTSVRAPAASMTYTAPAMRPREPDQPTA